MQHKITFDSSHQMSEKISSNGKWKWKYKYFRWMHTCSPCCPCQYALAGIAPIPYVVLQVFDSLSTLHFKCTFFVLLYHNGCFSLAKAKFDQRGQAPNLISVHLRFPFKLWELCKACIEWKNRTPNLQPNDTCQKSFRLKAFQTSFSDSSLHVQTLPKYSTFACRRVEGRGADTFQFFAYRVT